VTVWWRSAGTLWAALAVLAAEVMKVKADELRLLELAALVLPS
jgi:hypothetical protein